MAEESLRSTGRLSKRARIALGAFCVVVMAYSLVVAGQILLGLLVCALVVTAVLVYRLVGAFYRFVTAAERIAAALESREGTSRASRTGDSRGRTGGDAGDARSRDHVRDRR